MNATNQKHIGKQAKMEMGQPLATRHARDGCADGKGQPEAGAETQQHFVLKQLEKEIMEHDLLIAQLESQLSMSRENQKRNTLRLSQERERERQQELQQSQERERQQELQQSQERERQQELQQSQERERQQELQQSQERERQQELQQSQERERQQELQQSQERERQQKLQQSQERERQQKVQQSQERERQQKLQQSQERERQQKLQQSQERERQQELQQSQERERQQELQQSQERERQQKLQQRQERERQQKLQQRQERERQQKLQQSQERERQQKLQQSQERERQQELQQSQERERQQELQQSQERERQQELQQSQERKRQQELQQSQEREQQQVLQQSQERERQQELQQSQERERERQDMLLKKSQGGLPELEALIRMTAQIEDLRTFDDASIFFSRHEWTEWKQVEELLQKNVIKVPSSPQTLPGSAPERLCEARSAEAQGSGNGAVPVVSTSNVNNVRERKYPEKCGDKLQPERLLSIKQKLKLLHCPDRKEPFTPVTNPAVKVTENGATQASCRATQASCGTTQASCETTQASCGATQASCGNTQASCGTTQATAGEEAPHSGTRQFACPECGDIMHSKGGLLKHCSSHNAYKPFACSECGKSFKSKTWLVRHQRTHTGQYPFLCHECGVRFNWKRSLSQHQKIHAKEKSTLEEPSASCKDDELNNSIVEGNDQEKCGNRFSKKKPLGRRRKSILGGVTFGCNKCEKKFISRYFLYMHRRNIHPAEKPLAISTHGNKVKLKLQRVQEQRDHAGGESTSAGWSLGTNQGLQTGEKSFMCNNCGKCFSRKVKLGQHRRTHTGIRCEQFLMDASSSLALQ